VAGTAREQHMQAGAFVWEGTESDTVSVLTVFSKVKTESEFDYNNTTALIEKYFLIFFSSEL
jgi:hypothetical protein